jgi:hypothetical protein
MFPSSTNVPLLGVVATRPACFRIAMLRFLRAPRRRVSARARREAAWPPAARARGFWPRARATPQRARAPGVWLARPVQALVREALVEALAARELRRLRPDSLQCLIHNQQRIP